MAVLVSGIATSLGRTMSRQPPGAPPPPPVQRIRLRYTKRGRLRFTSHRCTKLERSNGLGELVVISSGSTR